MRRALSNLALAVCLMCGLSGTASANASITLSGEDAGPAAIALLQQGNTELAATIARGLLLRNPKDPQAHLVLSVIARKNQRYVEAIKSGNLAWLYGRDPQEKYVAALATAQAYSAAKAHTRAQLWLRRAVEVAPTPQLKTEAQRGFQQLKLINPWHTQISVGIQPSSNINNGSKSETMVIDGLPFALTGAAQALSGVEFSQSATISYRGPLNDGRQLNFGLAVSQRLYSLSDQAREQAPTARNSDFAFASTEVRFGYDDFFRDQRKRGIGLDLGRLWSGGAPISNYARVTYDELYQLSAGQRFSYDIGVERNWRLDQPSRSGTTVTTRLNWQKRTKDGGGFGFGLGARKVFSGSAIVAHNAVFGSASYQLGQPVLGLKLGANLSAEWRQYDQQLFATDRVDRKLSAGLSLFAPTLDFYGFAPQLDVAFSQNRSTLAIYETEGLTIGLGVRSAF